MRLHVILVKYTAPLERPEAVMPAHRARPAQHYRSVAGLAEYDIIAFTPVKRSKLLALGGVPLVE